MRLDRVTIRNFRRFRDVDLELPDGVIGLVGRNGAGKSTLLEAIGWCLFGHEAARTGKDALKRAGAEPHEDVSVRIVLRLGGHVYDVERVLAGKSGTHQASVVVDDVPQVAPGAQSAKDATRFMERALHMDAVTFHTSLVARQRELNALSDMTSGRRKDVILRMLRIDAVDDAIALARQEKRGTRERLAGLASHLEEEAVVQARVDDSRVRLKAARERAGIAEVDSARAAESLSAAQAARAQSEGRAKQHADLDAQLGAARASLDARRSEEARLARDLADLAEAQKELDTLAPRLVELPKVRERHDALILARERHDHRAKRLQDAARLRDALATLEANLAQQDAALRLAGAARNLLERARLAAETAQTKLAEADRERVTLEADIRRLVDDRERIRGRLARIAELGPESQCPTCTRPLAEHYGTVHDGLADETEAVETRLADARTRHLEAQRECRAAREAFEAANARVRELQAKADAATRAQAERESLATRIESDRARLAELDAENAIEGATPFDAAEYEEMRLHLKKLERSAERARILEGRLGRRAGLLEHRTTLAAEAVMLDAQIAALEGDLKTLGFDAVAHKAAVDRCDRAQSALAEARITLERVRGEAERLKDEVARAEEHALKQESLRREADSLRARLSRLDRLAGDRDGGFLVDFKHHLMGRLRPALGEVTGELLRELTDGKYVACDLDEDYELRVHDGGEAHSLNRFSGGEQDLANLALRLAIGDLLARRAGTDALGFLALDEVFGSLDEVRKGNVLRTLAALSRRFRQILVITHVDDVRDAVEHAYRVIEGEDGVSVVVGEA